MRQGNAIHGLGMTLSLILVVGTFPLAGHTAETVPVELEEITVTAQKREQSAEDIGISLTVLGREALEKRNITGLREIMEATPSLDVFRGNGSDNPTITLRGIGTTNPWVNNNPSVAVHADGMYLPMSSYLNFPVFDLQRIEVLDGPQVGLYGRNSTAGAINFVSARPTSTSEGYVDASFAEYEALDVTAVVSGPIAGDDVLGRFAAIVRRGGGYMERPGTIGTTAGFTRVPGVIPGVAEVPAEEDYGDRDIFAVRGSLEFELADNVDAFLTLHHGRDESELIGSTNINGDVIGVFTPPSTDPFINYDDAEPRTDAEQSGGVLEINWRSDPYRLTSLTGYESLDRDYGIGDFVPLRIAESNFAEELRSWSQELRLAYEGNDRLYWLIGAQYSQDDIAVDRRQIAFDFLLGGIRTAFEQDDEAVSVFAQSEFQLLPDWLLSGSVRYTEEDKAYEGGSTDIDPFGTSVISAVFPNLAGDGLFGSPEFSDDDVSGKIGLNWQPLDETLVYVSASRGFKSGGFDGSGITEPFSFEPFDSETIWAYELGTKLRTASDNLSFAGSVFYYDYDDKQVLALVDLGGGITEAVIVNAATSKVNGIDLELNWRPMEGLTLSASGTLLDTEITEFESADPAEAAAREGNELPGAPEAMFTASIDWQRALRDDLVIDALLWGTYVDSAFRDIENNPDLESDDYTLVNARIGFALTDRWSAYVFAHNLLDEEYVTSTRSLVGMLGQYHGAPRTIGGGLRYEFGVR